MLESTAWQKKQKDTIEKLKEALEKGTEYADLLWDAFLWHQNVPFTTSGRGSRPGIPFTYQMKDGRYGKPTNELLVSRKEKSKSITRSTVELALSNALEVQKTEGKVKGPKKLKTFGSSYLYAIFLSWGVIKAK